MERDRLNHLFQQYVSQQCSQAELEEFMLFIKAKESDDAIADILDTYWEKSKITALNKEKSDKILRNSLKSGGSDLKTVPQKNFKIWMGWAAAIMLLGIGVLWFQYKFKTNPEIVKNSKTITLTDRLKTEQLLTVKTLSEHQKINLPDGSTVILNNNSTITYPKTFSKERIIILSGEGYFKVKHDDQKSFTVYTGKLRTTVLGTAFNIKAYDDDKNIEVTVTRGKVGVLDSHSTLGILSPNQQITFNKDHQEKNVSQVVAKTVIKWQESDFFFDDISMDEAITLLSNRFNTPISFTNEQVKKCRFTATFLKGESLDEILKVICSFNHAQYQKTASGITIKGEGCE